MSLPGIVQRKLSVGGDVSAETIDQAAERGVATSTGALPHRETVQAAFGRHRIDHVQAHTGGDAASTAAEMNAEAYAVGHHVVFGGMPSLHTVAHEAAHVVQQRAGVARKGGPDGDAFERHADAVADAVVAGRSAEPLLDEVAGRESGALAGTGAALVQRIVKVKDKVTVPPDVAGPMKGWVTRFHKSQKYIYTFKSDAHLREYIAGESKEKPVRTDVAVGAAAARKRKPERSSDEEVDPVEPDAEEDDVEASGDDEDEVAQSTAKDRHGRQTKKQKAAAKKPAARPAAAADDEAADDEAADEEAADDEAADDEAADAEAKQSGATLKGYDSDELPEREKPKGKVKIWGNKSAGREDEVDEMTLQGAGHYMAATIRKWRNQGGTIPQSESKVHPPVLARMGSVALLFEPTPKRKDGAVRFMRRSKSLEHLERDGNFTPNETLAGLLDGDCTRNKLTPAKLKENLRHLRTVNADAKEDLPHAVDAACLKHLRELVAIWLVDDARSSRAYELIEAHGLGEGTFKQILAGAKPRYVGAPDGGSAALQQYTAAQKKKEAGDDDAEDADAETEADDEAAAS